MNEVFGKKTVTSSEFPVILFDAGGTLLHTNPSFEKFSCAQVYLAGHHFSEEEFQLAITKGVRRVNDLAEEDLQFQFRTKVWLEFFLENLKLDENSRKDLARKILENFALTSKMVIAESTVDLCENLKDRGYRLAIVSNSETAITEILRAQGVLQLFDAVITSQDVGFSKPHPQIFTAALEDMDVSAHQAVVVGDSYSNDILGARRAQIHSVLYDPELRELKALSPEDLSAKVVSIESLRHNRRLQDVKVILRLEELSEFFL
ncbi:MAG: HAD-IA family hydrolase [Deltaproteobacteria bacterium]|nr:HAD-IA family hydrolase [Deltaproteobacteria bacterium]